jgi:lipid II:glycine glycyltransferase (peptidoglycan interpeptide bridge formation enzyme)
MRLAGRRGVEVRRGSIEDLDLLYRMYAETSVRDGFVIRHEEYYADAWGSFIEAGMAQPFIAEVEGQPVAGLIAYRFSETAYYLYGMSIDKHREKMPNYLLQWEAMRWAKEQGCTRYDLWGAPDEIDKNDPMYGVYRFKDGFGAKFVRTTGAWDLPLRPLLYALYTRAMPIALSLMRRLGRSRTKQAIDR